MKNNSWVVVVVLVLLVGGAYMYRSQLKAMLMGSPPPVTQYGTVGTTPSESTGTSLATPSNNIYMSKTDAAKGAFLTDFNGMTLYTYDKDTTGVSNCAGDCLVKWPAYTSGATAQSTFPENISVITRTDGTKQFAWKGMPLYYWAGDTKAGDVTGDGVGGVWHLVKP